jgi:hypothetical protein
MFPSRHHADSLGKLVPRPALLRQHASTCRREPVEAATAFASLLDPRAFDPSAFFQPVEQRTERLELEYQPAPDSISINLPSSYPWRGLASTTDRRRSAAEPFFNPRSSARANRCLS